ncbi:unnamed protein product, partial [Polarella glacialis]
AAHAARTRSGDRARRLEGQQHLDREPKHRTSCKADRLWPGPHKNTFSESYGWNIALDGSRGNDEQRPHHHFSRRCVFFWSTRFPRLHGQGPFGRTQPGHFEEVDPREGRIAATAVARTERTYGVVVGCQAVGGEVLHVRPLPACCDGRHT